MQADSAANLASLNPDRLRNITKRFTALRQGGLNTVVLGICVFLVAVTDLWSGWLRDALWMLTLAPLFLFFRGYVPKYYERRFGHMEAQESISAGEAFTLLLFILGLFIYSIIASRANAFFASLTNPLHVAISDPDHRINLNPVLFFLAVLTIDLISTPWREQPGKGARGACVLALPWCLVVFLPLQYPRVAQFLPWKMITTGWLGLTQIAIGIHQHITLVRLFPRRVREENGVENE
jgi:hypothetical protein